MSESNRGLTIIKFEDGSEYIGTVKDMYDELVTLKSENYDQFQEILELIQENMNLKELLNFIQGKINVDELLEVF